MGEMGEAQKEKKKNLFQDPQETSLWGICNLGPKQGTTAFALSTHSHLPAVQSTNTMQASSAHPESQYSIPCPFDSDSASVLSKGS